MTRTHMLTRIEYYNNYYYYYYYYYYCDIQKLTSS